MSPADGKFSENITDMNVTGLAFANQEMAVEAENVTVPIDPYARQCHRSGQ